MKTPGRRKRHTSQAENAARAAIWLANKAVDLTLLLIILLLIAFGAYSLWDTEQIYSAADAKQYETYKPVTEKKSPTFSELIRINPDVFAWLDVYGTNIDYPVVWNEDNNKYLNMDPEGNFSLSGSLFLDSENRKDFSDPKNIIYGHHMEKEKMFGSIDRFGEEEFFNSHEYGNLYYNFENHGLAFFAFVEGDAYDSNIYGIAHRSVDQQNITDLSDGSTEGSPAADNADFLAWLRSHAKHWRETGVSADDTVVLLSTCASGETNLRYILVGVLTDRTYKDRYQEKEDSSPAVVLRGIADSIWKALPRWWYLLAALLAAALAGIAWHRYGKSRRR